MEKIWFWFIIEIAMVVLDKFADFWVLKMLIIFIGLNVFAEIFCYIIEKVKKEEWIMRIVSINDLVKVGEIEAKVKDYSNGDKNKIANDIFTAAVDLLDPEEGDDFELRIVVMKKRTLGKAISKTE